MGQARVRSQGSIEVEREGKIAKGTEGRESKEMGG